MQTLRRLFGAVFVTADVVGSAGLRDVSFAAVGCSAVAGGMGSGAWTVG